MNYKKFVLFIITIAVIAGGGLAFYYYKNSAANGAKQNTKNAQEETIAIENKTIIEKTDKFDISIAYPSVAGLDDFNKKAKDIIDKQLADFKQISLENDLAVKENDPESYAKYPRSYYLSITYEKGSADESTISIVFDVSNFTGGAHGAEYFIALNYDAENKEEIKLADLFSGQSDYLQKISSYCQDDLTKQIRKLDDSQEAVDASWISEGAGPDEENFSVFLINKDNIVFYFPQYQVAAYALGNFKVIYPR